MVSWGELGIVIKKAKKGQYGCWELYGDGKTSPYKARERFSYRKGLCARPCCPLAFPEIAFSATQTLSTSSPYVLVLLFMITAKLSSFACLS